MSHHHGHVPHPVHHPGHPVHPGHPGHPGMVMHPGQNHSSGSSTPSSVVVVQEDFQKQIQQDWANREYIEVITGSIKRICDFLNSFG